MRYKRLIGKKIIEVDSERLKLFRYKADINTPFVLQAKNFLENFFPFSGVCLHVKYSQICKIFFVNSKIFYKKL